MASQTGDFRQFTLSHDGSKAWYQTRSQDSVRIPYSRIYRTTDLSRHPVQIDVLGTGPLAFNPDDSLAYGENDFLSPPPTSFKAELHICDPISGAILSKMDLPLPSEKILVDSSNRYLFAATSESYSGGETNPLRVYVAFPPIVRSPAPAPKRLGNVSTRAFVQDNENVEIGGFIIQGDRPKKVVLRAMGPSLAKFGLPAVPDPVL